MKFSKIPGLLIEKEKLQKLPKSDRVPHALIFSGAEGTGKLAMALAFVAALQCKKNEKEACGVCEACVKTFKLVHPDIHFFFPNSGGKDYTSEVNMQSWRQSVLENPYLTAAHWQAVIEQENKLLNISADECRAMVKKLSYTIYEGNMKIVFLWLPEFLGHEGNILLKLIEEPPPQSLILLVTDNPGWLLPTIRSRCQQMNFPPFTNEDILSELSKAGMQDTKQMKNILSAAEGNMYEAIKMIEEQNNPRVEKMLDWLRLCFKNNVLELKQKCEQLAAEGREAQRQLLKFGLSLLDYALQYKVDQKDSDAFYPEDWVRIKGLANQLSFEDIERIAHLFNDHIIFIERNGNPKVLFHALSINLVQIFQKREVDTFEII